MKFSGPRLLLHLEGLAALGAAVLFYGHSGASLSRFILLFLAPDLSMLGYAVGPKLGAASYNTAHTYLGPLLLWALADATHRPALHAFCLVWIAHIGFDHLLGYGLKYGAEFKDTHLARI